MTNASLLVGPQSHSFTASVERNSDLRLVRASVLWYNHRQREVSELDSENENAMVVTGEDYPSANR